MMGETNCKINDILLDVNLNARYSIESQETLIIYNNANEQYTYIKWKKQTCLLRISDKVFTDDHTLRIYETCQL